MARISEALFTLVLMTAVMFADYTLKKQVPSLVFCNSFRNRSAAWAARPRSNPHSKKDSNIFPYVKKALLERDIQCHGALGTEHYTVFP